MKKLIVFSAIAACLVFSKARAQTVNGVRLTELRSEYIEVRQASTVGRKVWIALDYGQEIFRERKSSYIQDDDGKEIEFNSVLDCVNKLKNYGYELFQVYTTPVKDSDGKKSYVLKKK